MKLKSFSTAMAALSLVATPTLAAAAPVGTPLTQPATEAVDGDNALLGGGAGFFVLLFAVGAIALGVTAGVSNNGDGGTAPTSP